jgi:signal transduction histidine kinase
VANRSIRRLRLLLVLLFLGLSVPALLLLQQAFAQLELDAFRQQQILAEGLARQIDTELVASLAIENARSFDDYAFAADGTPSGLSAFPVRPLLPGTTGYFQVDADGQLTTPILPADGRAVIEQNPGGDWVARRVLADSLLGILAANALVRAELATAGTSSGRAIQAEPAEEIAVLDTQTRAMDAARGRALFNRLTAVGDSAEAVVAEQSGVPLQEFVSSSAAEVSAAPATKVSAFQVELDPLTFSRLDTGHFVLFRNAWRDDRRYVQGMLIEPEDFIDQVFVAPYENSELNRTARLEISTNGVVLARLGRDFASETATSSRPLPIHSGRLSPPLSAVEFAFFVRQLPRGAGFPLVVWAAIIMFVVLSGGLIAMYRFGQKQIALTEQQQNFVSAVSHELKTPLTSIRMYGEMLKAGWASDEKKQSYYEYIYAEGERLSRLIDNVLTLARIGREHASLTLQAATVGELMDLLRSKLDTQAEQAGFALEFEIGQDAAQAVLAVDADALVQIFINLVDNAMKYAAKAERRAVNIAVDRDGSRQIRFAVRDYGPGIPEPEMRRLFELFYRPDTAATRAIAGTGIGLSLVRELATAMRGRVDVKNASPGAEFILWLPE